MKRSLAFVLAPILFGPLWACGTGNTGGAAGHLDVAMLRGAAQPDARKLEIDVAPDGAVRKMAYGHSRENAVPDAIKKLVAEKLPGATVKSWEEELYQDGTRTFEAELETADKKECEVSARADGTYRYTECVKSKDDLPPAAKQWLDANLAGANVEEVEHREGPVGEEWSVEAKVGEAMHYLHFSATGELVARFVKVTATIKVPQ
jgi:hypothetical protein